MKKGERRKLALEILYRCGQNRFGNAPSPFDSSSKDRIPQPIDESRMFMYGDLAIGLGGPEFTYKYLPVRFIEEVIKETEKLARRYAVSEDDRFFMTELYTIVATVYFLNNFRQKLSDSIEELFIEATVAFKSLNKVLFTDGIRKRTLRSHIINEIFIKTESRRKEYLKQAFFELDSTWMLSELSEHYQQLKPIWREAQKIYRANRKFTVWKRAVKHEIASQFNLELPDDLIERLSGNWANLPEEIQAKLSAQRDKLSQPADIAIEHAARLCGADPYQFSLSYLYRIVKQQRAQTENKNKTVD